MIHRTTVAYFVGGLLLLAPIVRAQTVLQQKFPDGQKATMLVKESIRQIFTLQNEKREISSEQEMVIATENGVRDKDGELRQRQRIDSLKAKLSMPGGIVLEYDSTKPSASTTKTQYDMFLDLIKVNANANWSVLRNKDNRVTAIDGRDKILDTLDQAKRAIVKKQLDTNYLVETANQSMMRIPSTPVKPDESWELSETVRLKEDQKLMLKKSYTYRGEVDRDGRKLHQIDIQLKDVVYSMDRDGLSVLRLLNSKLHPTSSEGTLWFDAELGQVRESRESAQIDGDVEFDLNGNKIVGQINLTMSSSSQMQ